MPRPTSNIFSSLCFTLLKSSNNKYNAFCEVCKKTLCNTAVARLRAHRNKCRIEVESFTSDNATPTSLIIKTSSESSHDYTKNCDPLQSYSTKEEPQIETTSIYPSDTQYDDLDVDMRIVNIENAIKDECSAFGHYVATQLKKMNSKTCALVRFEICETLFNAEMGTLDKDSQHSS